MLRDRYKDKAPDFALGTESTVDVLSQYCDYTHGVPENSTQYRWLNFFRYTFPELILTDRGHRDDTDIKWKLNNTVLDGMRNDIEVYRCRGIISDSPLYQAYLKQINDIKENYKDCLLLGRYNDVFGFTCPNENLDARSFVSEDGKKMTVVVAYQSRKKYGELTAEISAPGYRLIDSMTTGTGVVDGGNVKLGQYDLAALLFEKEQ
jgi:hypothetical protein